jgi:hypothetical protein
MRERPADDTTKAPPRAPHGEGEREREPGDYYYDDGTGYEVYDPAEDDPEDGTGEDDATKER